MKHQPNCQMNISGNDLEPHLQSCTCIPIEEPTEEKCDSKDKTPCVCQTCDCNPVKGERNRLIEMARTEERQFILNVLDGIDIADEEMGMEDFGGGTKVIRLALASRII